jgi:hypothetical protein
MKIKHTLTPWSAEPNGGKGSWIKGASGEWAALSCGDTDASADANAEFIVRAVNVHDDLVAAVKLVRSIIGEAAPEGFNPLVGDWAARLFLSQHDTIAHQ